MIYWLSPDHTSWVEEEWGEGKVFKKPWADEDEPIKATAEQQSLVRRITTVAVNSSTMTMTALVVRLCSWQLYTLVCLTLFFSSQTSLTLMALLMTEQAVGLGYSLSPLYYKQHQANHNVQAFRSENDDANRVTPSMFMARYNPIGWVDMSLILLDKFTLHARGLTHFIPIRPVFLLHPVHKLNQVRTVGAEVKLLREIQG